MIRHTVVLCSLLPALLSASATPHIEHIDSSFFPKVTVTVRLNQTFHDGLPLLVIENGRLMRGVRITPRPEATDVVTVSYLSAATGAGQQTVDIDVDDIVARGTYRTQRWRQFGHRRQRTVTIRATGPGFQPVPCRLVLLHESGKSFEDLTSPGGHGRRGTGFVLPSGSCYAELRLAGLDCPLDHFRFDVRDERATHVHRRFGFLDLSTAPAEGLEPAAVHLEIERLPSRYPSIAGNLAEIFALLPPELPTATLPLPAGTYTITIRPARVDRPLQRVHRSFRVEILSGRRTSLGATTPWK